MLEEKHELEYKLKKTTEISRQQIKDLEAAVEQFNNEIKLNKENFVEQTIDLRKQIESMEAQIRADKEFIDVSQINISFSLYKF